MDLSIRNRNAAISRWKKIHSKVRLSEGFTKEKVAINSYLCGDGNISIRKKGFHHDIRFFLDDIDLAKRVVNLFEKEFNASPVIRRMKSKIGGGKGFFKVEICNKPVCEHLLKLGNYGCMNWEIPKGLSSEFKKEWIKCFFDCEAHVNIGKRQIQVKSVNGNGLACLKNMLEGWGIFPKLYGPYKQYSENHNSYYFLIVLGKENILGYSNNIGFYHPKKIKSLLELTRPLN